MKSKDLPDTESNNLLHSILRRSGENKVNHQLNFDEKTIENSKREFAETGDSLFDFNKSLNETNLNYLPYISARLISSNSESNNNMPVIKLASAQLSSAPTNETLLKKRKKNFSHLAKSLLIASRMFDKKSVMGNSVDNADLENDTLKSARSFTTARIALQTHLRIFEIGGFCNAKSDGLYDDPDDCDNFIICFADRTFRTVSLRKLKFLN